MKLNMTVNIKTSVIASNQNWIEGKAVMQLERTAALPGMVSVVGLPDLHPGKDCPIGAAYLVNGLVYPQLLGNDIGCGMALFQLELPLRKFKQDKAAGALTGLEKPWEGDHTGWLQQYGVGPDWDHLTLGTIGGGNHFVELQVVEEILDTDAFSDLKINSDQLMMLIHSGSRNMGDRIFRDITSRRGARGLPVESPDAQQYLTQHEILLNWAKANRALLALRTAHMLKADQTAILDCCHNLISPVKIDDGVYQLHRKGAVSSNQGPVIIPGSRGTLSYLVMPTGEQIINLWSLAHGAGRKWNRSSVKARLEKRFNVESLRKTSLGGTVICQDKELLYAEAPQAYKDITVVIQDLVDAGLITVIATLKPVITYKTML